MKIFLSALSIFLNLIFYSCYSSALENKILFKLNNEIITTIDIMNEINYLSIINDEFNRSEKNQKIQIAKNSLIKEKIKLIELLKYNDNISIEDSLFENIIRNYFSNLNVNSISDFNLYFKSRNIDSTYIKKKIAIEALWNQLIYAKYYKSVKIDVDEIKSNINNKKKQKEYLLSEIVFNLDSNENLELKENIIMETIKKDSFAQAALLYSISDTASNGGKLGWIKEAAMNNRIKKKLNNTAVGKHTNALIIPGGFLILKISDLREIDTDVDIEKEIEIIIQKKTNDQLNRFSNIYFDKIKKNTSINEL